MKGPYFFEEFMKRKDPEAYEKYREEQAEHELKIARMDVAIAVCILALFALFGLWKVFGPGG